MDIISQVLEPHVGLEEAEDVINAVWEDPTAYCESAVEWAECVLEDADYRAKTSSAALKWLANLN
ncbi:MAG: hypothetical protein JRN21_09235 [Nitrososphaerota archaeon]|nr:hypothetical protein [Nitrososphaerota archaeon]